MLHYQGAGDVAARRRLVVGGGGGGDGGVGGLVLGRTAQAQGPFVGAVVARVGSWPDRRTDRQTRRQADQTSDETWRRGE